MIDLFIGILVGITCATIGFYYKTVKFEKKDLLIYLVGMACDISVTVLLAIALIKYIWG